MARRARLVFFHQKKSHTRSKGRKKAISLSLSLSLCLFFPFSFLNLLSFSFFSFLFLFLFGRHVQDHKLDFEWEKAWDRIVRDGVRGASQGLPEQDRGDQGDGHEPAAGESEGPEGVPAAGGGDPAPDELHVGAHGVAAGGVHGGGGPVPGG